MSLPTVDDLKIHANMTSSVDDSELQDVLDAAIEVVEGLIGPLSSPGQVVETHRNVSSDVLVLKRMPVAGLVSVASRVGASSTPLTLGDYELDAASGLLRTASGARFYGSYTVTYTSGREVLPAAIRLAVLIIAAHLWETQRMPMQDSGPAGFGGMDGIPDAGSAGRGFAIPNRAQELLQSYMSPSIA
jgi:hypothetical protein